MNLIFLWCFQKFVLSLQKNYAIGIGEQVCYMIISYESNNNTMAFGTVKEHFTINNEKVHGFCDSEGTFHD
jgi:hypothetical protein